MKPLLTVQNVLVCHSGWISFCCNLCCGSLLDFLHFSFVSPFRIQAQVGYLFLIRMKLTWFSHGISGLVAIKETIFGGGQWDKSSYHYLQQISFMSNGLFPLLPIGNAYQYIFSDGFGRGVFCLLCLKKEQCGEGNSLVSNERKCCHK